MPRYFAPATTAEALRMLGEYGADARVLVGGTDLLVGMRHGTINPAVLIDLKTAADLPAPLVIEDDRIRVGPTLTMAALAATPEIRRAYPGLVEAANLVGSVAIRNRASLLGNVCNASPAADTVPALLVHDPVVTIEGPDGQRTIALRDFYLGPRATLRRPDELVVRLDLPRPVHPPGSAFHRLTRRRGVDLASVSVAAAVDGGGGVRLGMGAVGPTPLLSVLADTEVVDGRISDTDLDQLLEIATPISDVRAGADYRAATLRALARRAIATAAQRRNRREAS
jgi:CO/xanthine dehydrogenase FAD-binding subunit